jgi:hypothetical protein
MSGKFTRLKYDDCFFNSRVSQSVGGLYYNLYKGQMKNCGKCLPFIGTQIHGDRFDSKQPNQVDIETAMWRASYPFGCGRDKIHYLNIRQPLLDVYPTCSKFIDDMPTLLTHPKEHYRELEVDRFYDLHRDPAAFIHWDYPMNTQQQAKDNFKVRYPVPIDENPSFPPGQRNFLNR